MIIINRNLTAIICTLMICITVILVFFNPYHYTMIGGKNPVRDNWITGKTEILSNDGWVRMYPVADKIKPGDTLKDGKIIKRAASN